MNSTQKIVQSRDLYAFVPVVQEQTEGLYSKVFSGEAPDSTSEVSPAEGYQNLVASVHEFVDKAFDTDQADLYSPEAKAGRDRFTVGIIPPPGAQTAVISNLEKFINGGKAIDRGGFTKAGRALMKHGYREGSAFPKPTGNPAQVNAHGQKVLESIINHPEKVVFERPHPDFGKVLDIVVPGKGGAKFTIEGEMIGFLEP